MKSLVVVPFDDLRWTGLNGYVLSPITSWVGRLGPHGSISPPAVSPLLFKYAQYWDPLAPVVVDASKVESKILKTMGPRTLSLH